MVKIGVIGCGRIGERHVDAYKHLSNIAIVVADDASDAARSMAEKFHVEMAAQPADLLEDPSIDAIDVCVPTSSHAGVVLNALGANKHVFCEKPLCRTLKEAEAIAAAQSKSGRLVMVGYLYRFHPAFQLAKRVLDGAIIGRPHMAILRFGGRGSTRAWKHSAKGGGGATLEMMVHALDLAAWLLGPIDDTKLLASETLLDRRVIDGSEVEVDAEDFVVAMLRIGGAKVLCQSDLVTPSYMNYVEVHGDNGSLFTSILEQLPTMIYCRKARGEFNLGNNIRHFPQVNLFELELGQFVDALVGGAVPVSAVSESVHLMAQLEATMGDRFANA